MGYILAEEVKLARTGCIQTYFCLVLRLSFYELLNSRAIADVRLFD